MCVCVYIYTYVYYTCICVHLHIIVKNLFVALCYIYYVKFEHLLQSAPRISLMLCIALLCYIRVSIYNYNLSVNAHPCIIYT